MKRLLCLCLALVMVLGCLAGCNTETPPESTPEATEPKPTEPKPTEPKPTEPKPTEPKPTEPKPTEPKPTEPKPTEPKPTEPKPTEPKPTEPKPTEPKPTEPKPTEPKPTEPKPTEPTPTEPKPTEPKPTEPKPTEPKPTEPKPTEPKPTEPKPTEPKPTEPPTVPPTEPPAPVLGSEENPADLAIGEMTVSLTGGAYWFTWTAQENTTLMLELESEMGWTYEIFNLTAGEKLNQSGSSTDEMASAAIVIALKGDEFRIAVNTQNADTGTLMIRTSLIDMMGTAENPLRVHVNRINYIRIPAGETLYFGDRAQGTTLVISDAADAVAEFQNTVYQPKNGTIEIEMPPLESGRAEMLSISITNNSAQTQIYAISFRVPVGTFENPDTLVIGSNVAVLEKDDPDGYIFTWTATADGILTLTMPNDVGWCYSVYNLTSYVASAQYFSNDDPVTNTYSMEVKAGDVLQISVSTFNPKRPNKIPAGEVAFTAEFKES